MRPQSPLPIFCVMRSYFPQEFLFPFFQELTTKFFQKKAIFRTNDKSSVDFPTAGGGNVLQVAVLDDSATLNAIALFFELVGDGLVGKRMPAVLGGHQFADALAHFEIRDRLATGSAGACGKETLETARPPYWTSLRV